MEREGAARRSRSAASARGPSLPPVKTIALGLLVVLVICGWQLALLSRHVEPSLVSGNEAVWHQLSIHDANITDLLVQQNHLARATLQLSEELWRQREDLTRVAGKLPLALVPPQQPQQLPQPPQLLPQQQQELEESRRLISDLQQTVATLQSKIAGIPMQWGSQRSGGATGGDASQPSDGRGSGTRRSQKYPEEWLQKFSEAELDASANEAAKWRNGAREAFLHAWRGYRRQAWGQDEFKPVSGSVGRTWANCGLQILDALSTMWVMNLTAEFDEATGWVEQSLHFDYGGMVSFFEITIRALGGLASAHSLSGRQVFLDKARELADKMLPAFQGEAGFPTTQVNLQSGQGAPGWFRGTVLAEAGTVQLEFRYISQQTGDPRYAEKADRSMRSIIQASRGRGLAPWGLSSDGPPHFTNAHITFGAMGDSYYEYLLKMYMQTAKTEPEWKDVWKLAMKEMHERLILTTKGGLTYVAEENNGQVSHKMDHLACFVGGMLVYGARSLPKAEVDPAWERTAQGITETCYQMYHRQPSHLAPECVSLKPEAQAPRDMEVWNGAGHYLLRPEAAEAIFYMFYYTGDPKYRRMAGEIFEAIEAHTKTAHGYSAVKDVRSHHPELRDEMETFFLAETLKYLYLTFLPNPREVLDLEQFVFTTEAHPIRIFKSPGGSRSQFLKRGR